MSSSTFARRNPKFASILALVSGLAVLIGLVAFHIGCGGSASISSMNGTGTVRVSITDPPSCEFPNGAFKHVYVSIRGVEAHTSATADDNTPGWQELAPQLISAPMQIDLFAAGPNACLLTMLGSNTALPAGTYQQIRLLLVANDGSSTPPTTNACGNNGFNCVVLADGTVAELALSSQANTGLKIPPGQVVGGPITVAPGQDVDLNIDFQACESIIQEGNSKFRLKPVLTAGQVSTNNTGISGQAVDSATKMPIAGGTVLVALERQDDNTGNDVIFMETAADSSGSFNFCPLPMAATFDVVVVAINGAGVAYNATVAVGVPGGTNLGAIPLFAEMGASTAPGTLQGFLTATTGTAAAKIDASVSALQPITLSGGGKLAVTIPAEGNSISNISLTSNATCPATAPKNTNCAQYTLIEPASNPSVGTFSAGKISYAAPAAGAVPYSVRASAFAPMGGPKDCSLPTQTTSKDSMGNPLQVTAGATVTPAEIDFSGCS